MPRKPHECELTGAFPPRTIAFCQGAVSAVLAVLGTTALVLALAGLLTIQSVRPGFSQTLGSKAAMQDDARENGLQASDIQ